MAMEAQSFSLKLTQEEVDELLNVSGGGPVQQLQVVLREQLAGGNLTVTMTDPQLGRLVRFMTQGPAAVQAVLRRAFGRALGEVLSKA